MSRGVRALRLCAAAIVLSTCSDGSGPRAPRVAVSYVSGTDSTNTRFVVASADGQRVFATYALPFFTREAELSPNRAQIVFWEADHGIWLYDVADGTTRRLVNRDSGVTPIWSPDGKTILFGNPAAGGVAWVTDPAGLAAHPLTTDSALFTPLYDAEWSPDQAQIAFTTYASGRWTVAVMNANGTGARLLPGSEGGSDPTWSPDGRRIGFVAGTDTTGVLWTENADGTDLQEVTARAPVIGYPAWSPDGSRLAFIGFSPGNSHIHVLVVDIATHVVTEFPNGSTSQWSPHWIAWP